MIWLRYLLIFLPPAVALQDFQVENNAHSPGLYYDYRQRIQLSTVSWRILSYFNLGELQEKLNEVEHYSTQSIAFCKNKLAELNLSVDECNEMALELLWHINNIKHSQKLIGQLTSHQPSRRKRGVLNFIGEIAQVLFGVVSDSDFEYYKSKINTVETEQLKLLKLNKEQLTIVKTFLSNFNHSVASVSRNQEVLMNGMRKMQHYVQNFSNHTDIAVRRLSIMVASNEHLIRAVAILQGIQREYDLVVNAIVNSQRGLLQPHLINPVQVVQYLNLIRNDIGDKKFPIPLTEENGYLLLRIIDIDVFLYKNILTYVLNVPLAENNEFNLYRILPLPIEVSEQGHYLFLQAEKEFLLIDQSKRLYAKLDSEQLKCKQMTDTLSICKQNFILQATQDGSPCEVQLLQPIRAIPPDCVRKVVALNHSIWTALGHNEWIFVAPRDEGLTILCNNGHPTDVIFKGTGKLKFFNKCRGYGAQMLIQSELTLRTNVTSQDIIPNFKLELDCCVVNSEKLNITELPLNWNIEPVGKHLSDLTVAGYKIEELQEEISKQEQFKTNSYHMSTYSIISYVSIICIAVIVIFCICKHCKTCQECFKYIWRSTDQCCSRICINNTVLTPSNVTEVMHVRHVKSRRPLHRDVEIQTDEEDDIVVFEREDTVPQRSLEVPDPEPRTSRSRRR